MQSFMLHRVVVVVVVVVALLLVCMLQADAASGTRRILEEPKIRLKTEYPFGGRNSFANQELHVKADGGGDEESEEEPPGGTNSRPLIGILSQPTCGEKTRESERNWDSAPSSSSSSSNRSCIAASYVKFVESGGARAVPILYNEPEDSLIQKFAAINGILFPGGATSLKGGPFYQTAEKLFNMVIEANERGDYFPLYGVCLGFELLTILVSQNHSILERFDAEHRPAPLLFIGDWVKNHSIFQWVPQEVVDKLSQQSLAMENHQMGISPERWFSNKLLTDFFQVLTLTPDNNGKMYISTVMSPYYPVFGVQWHPEKNLFEWGDATIPHTADAVQLSQGISNYLISEARKSQHKPISSDQEHELMFYNYEPSYTNKDGQGLFEQEYWFDL
ncbi:hypothetical protein BDL97_19G074900 [Sphagnum fallax]|nr:hypothetical protein BDL97_19G074900 [Sphagnum fallax]